MTHTSERIFTLGTSQQTHQSVLAREAFSALAPVPGGVYVDATFGDGGHSRTLLQHIGPQGRLFALDRDRDAIRKSATLAQAYPHQLIMIHTPFSRLKAVLAHHGVVSVQGVLFDLGVSSRQLDEPGRGFSFQSDGPLDMRMDQPTTEQETASPLSEPAPGCAPLPSPMIPGHLPPQKTAATLVNTLEERALADLFFRFGEERHARRIARAIVQDRQQQPFTRTRQLATLLERILPRKSHPGKTTSKGIHPATRVFQALRIAVNQELEELHTALSGALDALACGGRVAVISFHSLEDRMVKQTFRQAACPAPHPLGPAALIQPSDTAPPFRLITRKPLYPSAEEIQNNPRSRSARMRVIERRPAPDPADLACGGAS